MDLHEMICLGHGTDSGKSPSFVRSEAQERWLPRVTHRNPRQRADVGALLFIELCRWASWSVFLSGSLYLALPLLLAKLKAFPDLLIPGLTRSPVTGANLTCTP